MTNGSMRASAGLLSLGLALVGAAACGDDTATGPTEKHPGDAIAEAQCARYDACCPGGAPVVGSGAECVEEVDRGEGVRPVEPVRVGRRGLSRQVEDDRRRGRRQGTGQGPRIVQVDLEDHIGINQCGLPTTAATCMIVRLR